MTWLEDQLKAVPPVPSNPLPSGTAWLEGFGGSVLGSIKGFVGIEKTPMQQRWDAEHPWSALGADLIGYSVPFVGWSKTLKSLPKYEEFVMSLGNAEKAPILTAGLQEAARYAPLEAGRIALSATIGDRPVGETIASAGMDLATIGVLSGVGQGLVEFGKTRKKLGDLVPGADSNLPPQLQMRMAKEYLSKSPDLAPDVVDTIKKRIYDFEKITRLEEASSGHKYVASVEGTSGKDINRLFDVSKDTAGISRKLFAAGGKGFSPKVEKGLLVKSASEQIEAAWAKTGFSPLSEELPYMQFPRFISAKKGRGAGFIQGAVRRDMQNVADNLWMTREKNNGMYVIAKKVAGGEKAVAGDQWVIFKTDTPGRFAPIQEQWAQHVVDKASWLTEADKAFKPTGSKLYDFTEKITQQFPMMGFLNAGVKSLEDLKIKLPGLEKVSGAKEALSEFANRYFTPAAFQFTKSPKANWLHAMSRAVYEEADRLSHEVMYGAHVLKDKNLWRASIQGTETQGGVSIKSLIDALTDKDLVDVWSAWNTQMSSAQVSEAFGAGKMSERAKDFLLHLAKTDSDMIAQIQTTQAAYDQELFKPLANHYMISRTWNGNWRVPVQNEVGQTIYMVSGKTKNQAEQLAGKLITESGKSWTALSPKRANAKLESPIQLAGYFNDMAVSRPEYFEAARAMERVYATTKPGFMNAREGVGGYVGQSAPWTKRELEEIISSHIQQQNRYMAKLVVNERFGAERARLLVEDPAMSSVLEDRLNDLSGKRGPIDEITNKLTDKVLAHILGPNSASTIASTTNQLFMHFNMGAGALAQPVLNMLTFTQTVLPELSFILGAAPERLRQYYTLLPVSGESGMVREGLNVLSPLKIMWQGFKEMGKPSAELFSHFERAANEGVVAPRMVEEYIGEGATKVGDLKKALASTDGFTSWLKTLSETLLAGTEKLSRGNAFVTGHVVGRDFLGLEDEALYQFSKKFAQRTMFGYSTADRSRVFTTPVGSMLGLFKNWMTHYIGMMLQYTGEGLVRGNWAPLLWQTAGTTAVGGLAAAGPMYFIADQFSKFATDKSLMDNTYTLFGGVNPVSDSVFFGLPALLGVSLSGNVAAPFSNPARDVTQLFSFVHMDRMNAISKAIGTAIDQWDVTGKNPLSNELVRAQLARAVLPKTIFRVAAAWEDKAIRSLSTGNVQFKDVTPVERLMYMSGLNPIMVDRGYRVADELWKDQEKMKNAVQAAGLAFYDAQKAGDQYTMNQIMFKAMAEGIDFSRVIRSAHARTAKEQGDALERKFNPKALWEKRMMMETR